MSGRAAHIRQMIKPWMMPIAMVLGLIFHNYMEDVAFLAPWLIFVMLLVTFCKVRLSEVRLTSLSGYLIVVQVVGALAVYWALRPIDESLAQGAFICVFCPTATAAPVITGMLGGNVARLATFSLVSNTVVALLAPALFAWIGSADINFLDAMLVIARRVVPLILAPLAVAIMLQRTVPKLHATLASHQSLSFYIWAVSLIIVVGRAVSFIIQEPASAIPEMVLLAMASLIVCIGQFVAGRIIGRHCGDRIAGAQGLGQKNTVLAIWMALTWLNPIASVAPAAYVLWQNTINSLQLYFKQKHS